MHDWLEHYWGNRYWFWGTNIAGIFFLLFLWHLIGPMSFHNSVSCFLRDLWVAGKAILIVAFTIAGVTLLVKSFAGKKPAAKH